MTYRNDHDAALARIDALESELARARADDGATAARAELDQLEAEIRRRRAERDRLAHDSTRYSYRVEKVIIAIATVGVIAAFASYGESAAPKPVTHESPPAAAPVPTTVPRSATRLVECAGELSRAVAEHTSSSQTCIEQIRLASKDPVLGDDVHALLGRWLAAEEAGALDRRDALASEVQWVIIPSFTP